MLSKTFIDVNKVFEVDTKYYFEDKNLRIKWNDCYEISFNAVGQVEELEFFINYLNSNKVTDTGLSAIKNSIMTKMFSTLKALELIEQNLDEMNINYSNYQTIRTFSELGKWKGMTAPNGQILESLSKVPTLDKVKQILSIMTFSSNEFNIDDLVFIGNKSIAENHDCHSVIFFKKGVSSFESEKLCIYNSDLHEISNEIKEYVEYIFNFLKFHIVDSLLKNKNYLELINLTSTDKFLDADSLMSISLEELLDLGHIQIKNDYCTQDELMHDYLEVLKRIKLDK